MKTSIPTLLAVLLLGGSVGLLNAQENPDRPPRPDRPPPREGPGPRGPGGPRFDGERPVPPFFAALDANRDGVIDTPEIDNAPAALRKLDQNQDGKLTMDELRPPRPDGEGRRPGGPPPNRGPRPDDGPRRPEGGRPPQPPATR